MIAFIYDWMENIAFYLVILVAIMQILLRLITEGDSYKYK